MPLTSQATIPALRGAEGPGGAMPSQPQQQGTGQSLSSPQRVCPHHSVCPEPSQPQPDRSFITSAEALFPNKVTFTVSRTYFRGLHSTHCSQGLGGPRGAPTLPGNGQRVWEVFPDRHACDGSLGGEGMSPGRGGGQGRPRMLPERHAAGGVEVEPDKGKELQV